MMRARAFIFGWASMTGLVFYAVWKNVKPSSPVVVPPATATTTRFYQEETAFFLNPERGFFDQNAPLWRGNTSFVVDMSQLRSGDAQEGNNGVSLIRLYFLIDEFIDSPISANALQIMRDNFGAARRAGVKVIPRFAYNFPSGSTYRMARDASLDQILRHITQLTPILQENKDVIAFMNLGFIGAWGEWHSSSNNHVNDQGGTRQINNNTRLIVDAILGALPSDRMVMMRYPLYKQQFLQQQQPPFTLKPLTVNQAYSSTLQARMGALNDCFLASETDFGTYWPNNNDNSQFPTIEEYKNYLNADNLYVPMSGETCNNDEQAQPFISCQNALSELKRMRWDALHNGYQQDVLNAWRQEGCYAEIEARLGYRFVLHNATIPTTATLGQDLTLQLVLENRGFGKLYNPRNVFLILRHYEKQQDKLVLKIDVDPRFWLPGQTYEMSWRVALPSTTTTTIQPGRYQVLIELPDPAEPQLRNNPLYSVRFANQFVWESETGYNDLDLSIEIS